MASGGGGVVGGRPARVWDDHSVCGMDSEGASVDVNLPLLLWHGLTGCAIASVCVTLSLKVLHGLSGCVWA